MANNTIQFYRGLEAAYNPGTSENRGPHWNAIYFATDSYKLLMNGAEYGGDSKKKISDIKLNTSGNGIVVTYTDSTESTILLKTATITSDGLMSKEDKEKLDNLNLTSALNYKGSVDDYSELPTENNKKGDVWNVSSAYGSIPAGTNYAWDGNKWDPLGGSVDLSGYYTKTEINDLIAETISEYILSLTSSDDSINIVKTENSCDITVNVSSLVSENSAIQLNSEGKLGIFWMEV